jgi:hypothetical protein
MEHTHNEPTPPKDTGKHKIVVIGVLDSKKNCIPPKVNRRQILDVVLQYMERHPEQRHLFAAVLVLFAIAEKFPCSQEK